MTYTIEHTELTRMLEEAATLGSKRALEQVGIVKKTITLKEIRDTYGKSVAEKARMSQHITWIPMGIGARDRVKCLMSEFDKFLLTGHIAALARPEKTRKVLACPCCGETKRKQLTKTPEGLICSSCGNFEKSTNTIYK